jgi:hypothetical protein
MIGDIAQVNHWKEGSPQKLALHGLAGLIEAKLGDGSIAGGILGGVAQELLAGELSAYLKANGFDVNEAGLSKEEREQRQADYDALMTLGATLAGTAAGALADGLEGAAAGAVAAQIGIKNNYLKHDELPRYLAALKKLEECQQTGGACAEEKQAVADWVDISKSRDAEITSCRDTGTCQKWLDEVQNDIALLNASITHIEDLRRDLYAEGNKTGSSALAGTVEVFKDQLADINSVFGAQYQQLFVNARAEYMATHPNASLTDFNERYGYNTTGVIAAVSGITAGWIAGKTSGGPAGNAKPVEGGSSAAEGGGLSIAEQSGILRDAAKGKGNFSLGQATTSEAEALGQAWVGPNYRIASDGKTLVSSDSLRTYRPPSPKDSPYATTGVQANFEQLEIIGGRLKAISNGHLNITP